MLYVHAGPAYGCARLLGVGPQELTQEQAYYCDYRPCYQQWHQKYPDIIWIVQVYGCATGKTV